MSEKEPSDEPNVETFREIVEAVWSGDLTSFDDIFAENAVIHTPFDSFEGREAYRAYVEESIEIVPDFQADIDDLYVDGDRVVARFTQRGTQTGAAPRIQLPATGQSFELIGANIAHFQNGRCVEMWTIWDKMEFVQQLGLFPDSPAKVVQLMMGQLKRRLIGRLT